MTLRDWLKPPPEIIKPRPPNDSPWPKFFGWLYLLNLGLWALVFHLPAALVLLIRWLWLQRQTNFWPVPWWWIEIGLVVLTLAINHWASSRLLSALQRRRILLSPQKPDTFEP